MAGLAQVGRGTLLVLACAGLAITSASSLLNSRGEPAADRSRRPAPPAVPASVTGDGAPPLLMPPSTVTPLDPATGIPARVLLAYQRAADTVAGPCRLSWTVLAGIGQLESQHADVGDVLPDGTTTHRLLGPPLGGDPAVQAEGPMQFQPAAWRLWSADGNADGRTDPSNVDDAALAAARFLCHDGGDLADRDQLDQALYGYNHAPGFVVTVLSWADRYARAAVAAAPTTPAPPTSPGVPVIPGLPGVPNEPGVPALPGQPPLPGQPAVPGQPAWPGQPVWPGQPPGLPPSAQPPRPGTAPQQGRPLPGRPLPGGSLPGGSPAAPGVPAPGAPTPPPVTGPPVTGPGKDAPSARTAAPRPRPNPRPDPVPRTGVKDGSIGTSRQLS